MGVRKCMGGARVVLDLDHAREAHYTCTMRALSIQRWLCPSQYRHMSVNLHCSITSITERESMPCRPPRRTFSRANMCGQRRLLGKHPAITSTGGWRSLSEAAFCGHWLEHGATTTQLGSYKTSTSLLAYCGCWGPGDHPVPYDNGTIPPWR